jgi:osmotically-inducible protein OsmY
LTESKESIGKSRPTSIEQRCWWTLSSTTTGVSAIRSEVPIHIKARENIFGRLVNRGHLKLAGLVSGQADKNIAEIRAKEVPGIFSVQNNLLTEK